MRVIAGSARGKVLTALPGEDVTRPTIDRVKEAMFSSVQFLVPGARVLDLFAGQRAARHRSAFPAGRPAAPSWTPAPRLCASSPRTAAPPMCRTARAFPAGTR